MRSLSLDLYLVLLQTPEYPVLFGQASFVLGSGLDLFVEIEVSGIFHFINPMIVMCCFQSRMVNR